MAILLQDITKAYARGTAVLQHLNFAVEHGEFVAVVGPSGCGKTTLLNLIGGLDRPDGGQLTVQGQALHALNDRDLSAYRNRTVGFIFQLNWLHPRLTALENVMLPALVAGLPNAEARDSAQAQLAFVSMGEFARRYPAELSGGQLQRVAIARALVMSPPVLLADEPTGNLDEKTGHGILEFITKLNREKGLTVLLVTHEPAIRQFATRAVHMENGRFLGAE
mgnify:CR=1 FL=1